MRWIVEFKDKIFNEIKHREYPYIDNKGHLTNPYKLWYRDYCQDYDNIFYEYLGVEYVEEHTNGAM